MHGGVQEQHHYMVAWFYAGITSYKHTLSFTYQACNGHVGRQFQVLYHAFCHFGSISDLNFSHISIGQGHECR